MESIKNAVSPSSSSDTPVSVSLSSLQDNTVSLSSFESAFGPSSLGILLVTVLASATILSRLPPSKLETLTNAEAKYLVGWSHGKETLGGPNGTPDTSKGSFYANCSFYNNNDARNAARAAEEDANWAGFSEYTAPNLWPAEVDIPSFRANLEGLATLIIDVAVLVARACDRYAAAHVQGYPAPTGTPENPQTPGIPATGYLENMVRTSRTTKARLLHYFPPNPSTSISSLITAPDADDWCGPHLDHGCLTGLTSAMFTDESLPGPALADLPSHPDPAAGLYIHSRAGKKVHVRIPRDALAFQTGEALQLLTRGKFKAVPHFVKGVGSDKGRGVSVGRNTLAVFTQPNLGEVVDWDRVGQGEGEKGGTFGQFARGVVEKNTATK